MACEMDFAALAELCAPNMGADILSEIVAVESSGNPYAIGVVGAHLQRQPRSLAEAVATTEMLERAGYNYSLGLAQINRMHFARFGMTGANAFDPCRNIRASSVIWNDCLDRAGGSDSRFGDALSCYNSGNFTTGYRNGYVTRVLNARLSLPANGRESGAIDVVPDQPPASRRVTTPARKSVPEALLTTPSSSQTPKGQAEPTALLF
jgi:type IV secretion system protein VirB1